MTRFQPFTGFDPMDGEDPRVTASRDNPVSSSAHLCRHGFHDDVCPHCADELTLHPVVERLLWLTAIIFLSGVSAGILKALGVY